MASTVVELAVAPGAAFANGQALVVVEAMKMEHELRAEGTGRVRELRVAAGDAVEEGEVLLTWEPVAPPQAEDGGRTPSAAAAPVAPAQRPELMELQDRLALTADAARPDAVARRRATGQRTARENIADLCDPGSFIEYGAL